MSMFKVMIAGLLALFHASLWALDPATLLAEHYLNKIAVSSFDTDLSPAEAMAVQERFVTEISKTLGPVVGYKAGLTNAAVQEKFGVSHPLRGVLLEKMLLKSPAVLPAAFGAVPLSEGDLLVRVGSAAINQASTAWEALTAIDAVIPFIELPDMVYAKDVKLNAAALTAIGVAARYGVMGEPIPVEPTSGWQDRLGAFRLQIRDADDKLLTEGSAANLLGHPLNVVLWLKDSLAAEGKRLKKGDLLSLGTITKLMPVRPATTVKARYLDLDPAGPIEISVRFE